MAQIDDKKDKSILNGGIVTFQLIGDRNFDAEKSPIACENNGAKNIIECRLFYE